MLTLTSLLLVLGRSNCQFGIVLIIFILAIMCIHYNRDLLDDVDLDCLSNIVFNINLLKLIYQISGSIC